MERQSTIQKLDLSDEALLDAADRRLQAGDCLGALTMLNKRNARYQPTCDSALMAADIYEEMGLYGMAAAAWYHFLDTCNEADFAEGYEGLAVSFMNMGNEAQSAFYYHRMLAEDEEVSEESKEEILRLFSKPAPPPVRIIWTAEGGDDCSDVLQKGLFLLRAGDVNQAREAFAEVPKSCRDYPTAVGLSAMCALMAGDAETAERECRDLIAEYPEDVQALTTYCAVLSERGDKEGAAAAARRLAALPAETTDDLYKIATALCETGLDEEAFEKLTQLKEKMPYDKNVLWFLAASACKTGRTETAIDTLDLMCTVYPRAAVASYYLERLREGRDGGKMPQMSYFYRLPEEEHAGIAAFLTTILQVSDEDARRFTSLEELKTVFALAFDEMEGRDEALQALAVRVALVVRADDFLREALLDYEGEDLIKFSILAGLAARNEEDSFGTVICNLYKEFFIHKLEIGDRKEKEFLRAYAEVYSKYALFGEENEKKIVYAAEDTYRTLADAEAWDCMDEKEALAAVIYREAHLRGGERDLKKICSLFGAKRLVVQSILDRIL